MHVPPITPVKWIAGLVSYLSSPQEISVGSLNAVFVATAKKCLNSSAPSRTAQLLGVLRQLKKVF